MKITCITIMNYLFFQFNFFNNKKEKDLYLRQQLYEISEYYSQINLNYKRKRLQMHTSRALTARLVQRLQGSWNEMI